MSRSGQASLTALRQAVSGGVRRFRWVALPVLAALAWPSIAVAQNELIVNGGFESGLSGWVVWGNFYAEETRCPKAGDHYAYLSRPDGYPGNNLLGTMYQQFSIPADASSATLEFWVNITSEETSGAYDFLDVTIQNSSGVYEESVRLFSNLDKVPLCQPYTRFGPKDLTQFRGRTIRLHFLGTTDESFPTVFRVDEVSCRAVISEPRGACCFSDGRCQDLPQANCAAQGGTWHQGTDCANYVCPQPGRLSVDPPDGLNSSGPEGGPFNPSSKDYTLRNVGDAAINWSASATQNWVSPSYATGSLPPGQWTTLRVSINANANALPAGSYPASVSFRNTTNGNGDTSRLVQLTVTPVDKPLICRAPATLTPSVTQGQNAPNQSFEVWNCGKGTLNYTIDDDAPWLSVNPTNGSSTGQRVSHTVTYSTGNLTVGMYFATIRVHAPGASNSPQSIAVTLTVERADAPKICCDPLILEATVTEGGSPSAQRFSVRNCGTGSLQYTITTDADWLSVTPLGGGSMGEPLEHVVQYGTSHLGPGTYGARITVSAPRAMNSPQKIDVKLNVTAASGFRLYFPLRYKGWTAYTAEISSVFDHAMTTAYRAEGGVISWTNERGTIPCDTCDDAIPGRNLFPFKRADGKSFSVNDQYVGSSDIERELKDRRLALNYDGHSGYDYPVLNDTRAEVVAAAGGRAQRYESSGPGYGKHVRVDHGNGFVTLYAHLSSFEVAHGAEVVGGQTVVGRTGRSGLNGGGEHLHFEVRRQLEDGRWVPVDPYGWEGAGERDPYVVLNPGLEGLEGKYRRWRDEPPGGKGGGTGEGDRDGDGVPDAQDACPDTKGVPPLGCPTPPPPDEDNDGVADDRDRCPETAPGEAVDEQGCSECQLDVDADGASACIDCDDANPGIFPGAPEIPGNNIDEDCDGSDAPITPPPESTWYRDADADGWGNVNDTRRSAQQPAGYVALSGDCDEGDASTNPAAAEVPDGKDNNCNGQVDEGVSLKAVISSAEELASRCPAGIAGENGKQVVLDGSASTGAITSYEWLTGGRVIGTEPKPVVCLPPGEHEIVLVIKDSSGRSDSTQRKVTVAQDFAEVCDDGKDNDGDGLVDEADPDCSSVGPVCPGGPCGGGLIGAVPMTLFTLGAFRLRGPLRRHARRHKGT